MPGLRHAAPVLLVVSALLLGSRAAPALTIEVPGVESDELSKEAFVRDVWGSRWYVHASQEHSRVYYEHRDTGKTAWEDPRTLPLTDADKARVDLDQWEEIKANHTRLLIEATGGAVEVQPAGAIITAAATIPLLLFAAAVTGRIWYLHAHHPEMLFPTKERKQRRRQGGKFRPQKTRGKLNQDGKGGRSANT